ncbi:MAG: DUF2075 domain-containing protein [Ignavibacteria bacterium]|nr:DUF2075 domain-containing protein [Ignavibacteria bacterium]
MNCYYQSSIEEFLDKTDYEVLGEISSANQFDVSNRQNKSWEQQLPILKSSLSGFHGTIFIEFSIPRMGKRVDAIAIIKDVVFVIEFKVGESRYTKLDLEQVWDYALDLKNFHKPSHNVLIAPILVATEARSHYEVVSTTPHNDNMLFPIKANKGDLRRIISSVLDIFSSSGSILGDDYLAGSYSPTPTIIEAALKLYNQHSVDDITRSDADATNLTKTTDAISKIIEDSKNNDKKVICFVTGVPGAGKTLVGLKVATAHLDNVKGNASVYLSGNGPLVSILQEALSRDRVAKEKLKGNKLSRSQVKESVKAFIQNIHHYRDEYIKDHKAPYDHVAIFDEAQRAWNRDQTVKFMKMKKGISDFTFSEPEFLISCLDRHPDWAVVICLVGGGQEINTGEAGITEWLKAIDNLYPTWEVYVSPNLTDSEYAAQEDISRLDMQSRVNFEKDLHLAVSMRSFRAENLSFFVKNLLDLNTNVAIETFTKIKERYPIVLTRDIHIAKNWLKTMARGSERYGIVVSSQAERLKPLAIDVKSPMDPVKWFLEDKDDVRSSFYLEAVATEFHVQGLELDWACVTWDGDLRYSHNEWKTFSFRGNKWQNINSLERKKYLINAYRVLLTRARQGMVIVVPNGNSEDHTRKPEYYDDTYNYLKSLGLDSI